MKNRLAAPIIHFYIPPCLRFLRTVAVPAYGRWCHLHQTQQRVSVMTSGVTSICDRTLRRVTQLI